VVPSGAGANHGDHPTTTMNPYGTTTTRKPYGTTTTTETPTTAPRKGPTTTTSTSTSTSSTTSTSTSTSTTSTTSTSTSTTSTTVPTTTPFSVTTVPTTTPVGVTTTTSESTSTTSTTAKTFSFSAATRCTKDAPWVDLQAHAPGFSGDYTLHWLDASGTERLTQQVPFGAASILYPGATTDATGEGTDWPGWIQKSDGTWVEGDDGLLWVRQPGVKIFGTINPTSQQVALTYPPATPTCHASPPNQASVESATEASGSSPNSPLAFTGGQSGLPLGVGAALIVCGFLLMLIERRRITNR
jgi:hypothetical protein